MNNFKQLALILLCIALVPLVALGQTDRIDELKEKAEKGDAEAQVILGTLYTLGQGVLEDKVESFKWYRKAVATRLAVVVKKYLKDLSISKVQNHFTRYHRSRHQNWVR